MELNLKILAPLLRCTSINRCALFMREKKKLFFLPIKKLFFSLSHSVPLSLSPKSLSLLSQITITQLSLCASLSLTNHLASSPKSLKLSSSLNHSWPSRPSHSPKTFWSSHPLSITPDPVVPRPQITHRHSSLTVTLSISLIHRRQPDPTILSRR